MDALARMVFVEITDELAEMGKTILDLPIDTVNHMANEAFVQGVQTGLMDPEEEIPFKKLMGKKFIYMAERLARFQRDWL